MTPLNKMSLNLKDDEELSEAFSTKNVGETVKLEVEAQIDEKSNDMVVMTVTSAGLVNYKDPDRADEGNEGGDEPTSMEEEESPAMMMTKKKGG